MTHILEIPGIRKIFGMDRLREIWEMDDREHNRIARGFDCQFEVARYLKKRRGGVCRKVAYMHGDYTYAWVDADREVFLAGGGGLMQPWTAVCFVPKTAHGKLAFLDAHQRGETLYETFERPEKWIQDESGSWVRNPRYVFGMRN